MKNLIIIPARGGSKRLPGKNIKELNSLPLIVYSINYALENLCTDVYVTTDDECIKKVAIKYGAYVIDRPKELATDTTTTVEALKHAVKSIDKQYDNVILLQPTNPLRPKDLLKKALLKFEEGNYDSLMTVTQNHHKLGKLDQGNFIPYNYTLGQRSQDLEPLYYENGLLYITKPDLILEDKILGNCNYSYILEHIYSTVDIDDMNDFNYAEIIAKNYPNE